MTELLDAVNEEYLRLNISDGRLTAEDASYKAPELLGIQSNQVLALINVLQNTNILEMK